MPVLVHETRQKFKPNILLCVRRFFNTDAGTLKNAVSLHHTPPNQLCRICLTILLKQWTRVDGGIVCFQAVKIVQKRRLHRTQATAGDDVDHGAHGQICHAQLIAQDEGTFARTQMKFQAFTGDPLASVSVLTPKQKRLLQT